VVHVARIWEPRSAYRVLVGKPEGNRLLGRPRLKWENDIKMYIKGMVCEVVDWIQLAQNSVQRRALAGTATNLRMPQKQLSNCQLLKKNSAPWNRLNVQYGTLMTATQTRRQVMRLTRIQRGLTVHIFIGGKTELEMFHATE